MRYDLNLLHERQFTIAKLKEIFNQTTVLQKFILVFFCTILTGIAAQIRIPLPWTPVPITLQSFIVMFSGIFLSGTLVLCSQILYIFIGVFFIPWFANFHGGIASLVGPTGGYLIGFLCIGFFIGKIFDHIDQGININKLLLIFITANLFLYTIGLLQLLFWYKTTLGINLTFYQLVNKGVLPFLPGDSLKIVFITLYVYYRW